MDSAPLTLRILQLTPLTLIPTSQPPTESSIPPIPLPPPPPPDDFAFSPTPNYPPPLGTIHIGSMLACRVALENSHRQRYPVLGVKMMLELQTPTTRTRLGEVIHGKPSMADSALEEERNRVEPVKPGEEEIPELAFGERVELSAESEVKDLGLGVVIAITPLSIKTRIQSPTHPNTLLSPSLRHQTFLEVLMQNTSPTESLLLSTVALQPVEGLVVDKVSGDALGLEGEELQVGDVRQYLFVLSPISPPQKTEKGQEVSKFPPTHAPGEILPLGRLAISWISGPYHTPGNLLTSMLNRRAPALASLPAAPALTAGVRDSLKPPGKGPAPGPATPGKLPVHQPSPIPASPSPLRRDPSSSSEHPLPVIPSSADANGEETKWTYDLVMLSNRRGLKKETTCPLKFRLSIRSAEAINASLISGKKPALPRLAVQYLTPLLPPTPPHPHPHPHNSTVPQLAISAPSLPRTSTPLSHPPPSARPFTPSSASTAQGQGSTSSRPITPLRAELKSAVGGFINNNNNTIAGGSSRPGTPTSVAGAGAGAGKREFLQPHGSSEPQGGENVMLMGTRSPWPPSPHVAFNSSNSYRPAAYPAAMGVAAAMARVGSGQSHTSGQGRKAASGEEARVVEVYHMGNSLTFLDDVGEGEVREVVDWFSIPPPPLLAPAPAPPPPDLSVSAENAEEEGADKSEGENTPIPGPIPEIKPSTPTEGEEGKKYWEASVEWSWDFLGWDTGVGVLGGLRVLRFDDDDADGEKGETEDRTRGGSGRKGTVEREWDCLGDVWVV
ncbi:hypothetical protein L202_03844 [Cryptococcus amylolentus CBS 6039]|uniref:Trafficking protein particle complex subunit 13 middle domain-containing protein n=1 Tax=Cryptococcus amylolentus CBS 6039 TaxID=1295533 RepID=A0A1E3HUG0_9TREE|nr:hypothetical protein L202_03844 [Cryptococcus amylolentus CBS 6039]ODN79973.1 hypothetical protein L202_03844 [Cryptococcus amylolentus CBS 6039]